MRKLSENNFNLIWVIHMPDHELGRFCELARKHNLNVAAAGMHLRGQVKWGASSNYDPVNVAETAKGIVNRRGDIENLIAHVGLDEPRTEEMMAMNSVYAYFKHFDPVREFWLVIRPHNLPYAMRYLDRDILLTVDPYFFFHPCAWMPDATTTKCQKKQNVKINMTSRLAKTYDRPFMLMPQVFTESFGGGRYFDPEKGQIVILPGSFLNWRQTTPTETTWQIWNGLAKGAKGFVTFTLFHGYDITKEDFIGKHGENVAEGREILDKHDNCNVTEPVWVDDGLVRRGLEMAPQFHALGKLNGELAPFSELLSEGKPAPPLCLVDNDNLAATFEYGGDVMTKKYYAVVVNNDTENAIRQEIKTLPCVLKATNLLTGEVLEGDKSESESDFLNFAINLNPGGGALLTFDLPSSGAYSRIDYLEFVSDYEKNRRTELDNLTIHPTSEGRERPCLRVETKDKPGYLAYALKDCVEPTRYKSGNLFFVFNANGPFKVSFLAGNDDVIKEEDLAFSHLIEASEEKFLIVPKTARKMKLEFQSDESALMEISLLYSHDHRN
ncbi:MAG: hypothetical protein JW808_11775 [Victivallales bacterium]|nr:hypothetical protein [Victivallales bacterium]